ncbi:MAG TPA: sucrase ferredoxin [Frankiaceae bacterium]
MTDPAPVRFLCSAASEARGEPLLGTASRVDRWVLLEQPGPWGPRSLPQCAVPDEVLLPFQRRAAAEHARTLAMRYPGRAGRARGPRRVVAADSREGTLWVTEFADDRALAAALPDLVLPFGAATPPGRPAAAAPPAHPGWSPLVGSLVGVCTHGLHDTCCAVRGRPVVTALAAALPEQVVELSHIGGDRFAANALVLPAGHYLGHVPAEAAVALVGQVLAGTRPTESYRGRSTWAVPVQAAEHHAALALGITTLGALHPTGFAEPAPGTAEVTFERGDAPPLLVRLHRVTDPRPRRLTCQATTEARPSHWELTELVELPHPTG